MQASYLNKAAAKSKARRRVPLLERLSSANASGPLVRVDVRAKILISLLASAMTIVISNPLAQLVLFGSSLAYALGMRRPKLLLAAYLICLLMLLAAAGCAALMAALTPLPAATWSGMAVPFLRLAITLNVLLPLAFCTPLQSLLTALKSIWLPFFLYIPLAVMVRYIPTFMADFRQISEALKIRGYNLSLRQLLRHPLLSLRFITAPLLFRSLKTADDLGIAAELKGLGAGRKVCPYRVLTWKAADSLLLGLALLVCLAALAVAIVTPEGLFSGTGGMR